MRLLVLGTGAMANGHAEAFSSIEDVSVVACVDLHDERARTFALQHGIPHVYPTLEAAIEAGGIDAMTNVTPDKVHFATTLLALQAGLHVFCEKPLATSHADALKMTEAAGARGLVNGVNLTYRNVAALQRAREIIADGTLGEIRHFEAAYLQSWLTQPAWGDWKTEEKWLWRLSERHGSTGVLGDIGIHIFDFATFAAGSPIHSITSQLKTFDKAPDNRIGDYLLDANDSMTMTVQLECGATGVIHATRFAPGHLNDLSLRIFGTKGGLELTNAGTLGTLRLCAGPDLPTATWREVALSPVNTNYHCFAEAVRTGTQMKPDFATATRLQAVIDAAFRDRAHEARMVVT